MNQTVLNFIPQERRTQKQDILHWLNCHGSLTRIQAFTKLGVCELSSRIGELEKDGYVFPREWLDGRAENGRKWRVVKYLRPDASNLTNQFIKENRENVAESMERSNPIYRSLK